MKVDLALDGLRLSGWTIKVCTNVKLRDVNMGLDFELNKCCAWGQIVAMILSGTVLYWVTYIQSLNS